MSLNVVKIIENKGPYRTTIKEGNGENDYKKNEYGQYILPKHYYSAGYYSRLTGGDYMDLPELNKVESLKQNCANVIIDLIDSNKLDENQLNILPYNLKKDVI